MNVMVNKLSDHRLVGLAVGGDAAAFNRLVERHYDLIFRLCVRMLSNKQDAEDVTQDICVSLVDKMERFHGKSKFTTWLYQVTINACRDYLRRRSTIERIQSEFMEVEALQAADEAERRENIAWAYEQINKLGDDLRETALLVVAEGLSHAEAGRILQVSENTISWRMMKIRNQLKTSVESEAREQND